MSLVGLFVGLVGLFVSLVGLFVGLVGLFVGLAKTKCKLRGLNMGSDLDVDECRWMVFVW